MYFAVTGFCFTMITFYFSKVSWTVLVLNVSVTFISAFIFFSTHMCLIDQHAFYTFYAYLSADVEVEVPIIYFWQKNKVLFIFFNYIVYKCPCLMPFMCNLHSAIKSNAQY